MPATGLKWIEKKELMTYEELLRLSTILVNMGVDKIRITGGEPFVRKNIFEFLEELSKLQGLKQLTITTNGILTAPHIPGLKRIGINSVNLSLDTLDRGRFLSITRRDELPAVLNTLHTLLANKIDTKINAVVMEGKNTEDIIPLTRLTERLPVAVRFIEEMPFNGSVSQSPGLLWNHAKIFDTLQKEYPDIQRIADPPFSTSSNYQVPGFKGSVGIIAAYSRLFCGTCNRIRITPIGDLKTCLYDDGVLNVKNLIRENYSDDRIKQILLNNISHRPKDGFEAERLRGEKNSVHESMATIGG
jgi:cyclic pyranopterin phosphate synthase